MRQNDYAKRIERALGRTVNALRPLAGGCVAEVYAAHTGSGTVVAKVDSGPAPSLHVEAYMLGLLAERSDLPVPGVLHSEPDLLVIEHIEHDGRRSDAGERAAADMLADLHALPADRFGLERDTLIGPLPQPNPCADDWPAFFAEHRLLSMARGALDAGRLSPATMERIERLASRLDRELDHAPRPSLVHGDVWSGNVLWRDGRPAAFIDPAVYHADREVELAFIDLFGCFGRAFWARYHEREPIAAEFHERRKGIYNLYPLLVHARLFGGGYEAQAAGVLRSLGL